MRLWTALLACALASSPAIIDAREKVSDDNPNKQWLDAFEQDIERTKDALGWKPGFAMCVSPDFVAKFPGWITPGYYREDWDVRGSGASFKFQPPIIDSLSGRGFVIITNLSIRSWDGGIEGRDEWGRRWWFAPHADQVELRRR